MKNKKNTIPYVCIVIATFIFFLTLNILTPYVSDDFAHYFGVYGKHPTSLKEIISNLAVFRKTINGRVIAHFFVYSFLSIPKWIFNIVNAAVATLLPLLIIRYCNFETPKIKIFLILICISMLWAFIQSFGQVFLWLTGSCNYLWGLCLFLALIYPLYCEFIERENNCNAVLLCILAFITGAYSECGSAATGLAIGIFTISIWIKNKKFPIKYFIVCLFALAGFVFLMFAPATDTRTGTDYMRNIWYIRVCIKDYSLSLIILYAVLLVLSMVFKINKHVIIASIIISVSGFFSILTFIFAAYLPARSFFVINTFLILSSLILLSNLYQTKIRLIVPTITVLMFAVFLARAIPGAKDIYNIYSISQERMLIAIEQQNRDVELSAYRADTMYPAVTEEELSEDPENWYNDLVAKYYGFKSVAKKD